MSKFAQYILAASPSVIYTCKAGGDYAATYVSKNVADLLGYAPEEFIDDPAFWKDRIHPDDVERVMTGLTALFNDRHHSQEYRFRTKSGEYRWMRDELRRACNPETGSEEIVGSWLDITGLKQTEQKLRDSEERLRKITGAAHDAILMMDPRGAISYWNAAAEKILGYRAEETLGKNLHGLLAPERYLGRHAEAFPLFRNSGNGEAIGRTLELTARRKDGAEIEVALSLSSILLDNEWHAIGILRDITEKKLAEEELRHSHELLKYIIEHTRSAVAVHDRELRYLYVSQRYLDEYNVRESNIIGRHHYEVFPDLPQNWREVHQRALAGEVLSAEEDPYARADGSVEWTRWECRPWYETDGSIGGIVVYTEVITQRKRAEENLRKKTMDLEEANRELEAFSYTLSHDLRSHLARISLAGETLRELEGENLGDNGQYLTKAILDTCESMEQLIATMLALANISRQELQRQEVNLSALAECVCSELVKAESARALHFDITPGLCVTADINMLQVVLQNLLGNACKYTRGKEVAHITLSTRQEGRRLVFAVADNGTGFDMAEAEKLFVPFQRLSNSHTIPGFGIGLATVERIIKRHGGEIWAKSVPGQGATFYFTLPE